jgi:lipopolysaccharide transport system ATP-binding protein
MYDLNLFGGVKGQVADWIRQAARMQVVEGDYFGTGRVPPAHAGLVMTGHVWSAQADAPPSPGADDAV